MSGRERSKEGSFLETLSWILLLPPFSFLQLSYSVLFLPFCLSLCHYPFSLCHFYPHSVCALYLSLRGFHLDLQTPPPGATLITYGGNRKCGLKSKLKWDFHYRLLIFWWQYQGSYFLNIFFIKFVLSIISANEEKWCDFDLKSSFSWPEVAPSGPEWLVCSFKMRSSEECWFLILFSIYSFIPSSICRTRLLN